MTAARQAAPVEKWLAEPLPPEVTKALDRLAQTEDVVQVAVLPDCHLAKEVCVGVAFATDSLPITIAQAPSEDGHVSR